MKVTKINLEKGNRMIRLGFGQHNYNWFVRIDLWCVAYRLTKE